MKSSNNITKPIGFFLVLFLFSIVGIYSSLAEDTQIPDSLPPSNTTVPATKTESIAPLSVPVTPYNKAKSLGITPLESEKYGLPDRPVDSGTSPATPSSSTVPVASDNNNDTDTVENTDDLVYLNATDADITDIIKQISKATGTNFLLDDKLKGKITILSEKPMTKDMAYQAFLSALEVMGYTTVTSPSGLVKIVPTKEAINKPLELYKGDNPTTDRFITRILDVKNISANDLSQVVKSLVSKDGNLFAYPATNSLILTDTGANIERILKIVQELDHEGPQEVIEIIPIEYADAADITDKISSLFDAQGGKSSKASGGSSKRGGKAEAELEDNPSISKIISDDRTNSVIILGTKRAIAKVKALIAQLDSPISGSEGDIHVYYLKYANAKELAEVLASLTSGKSSKTKKSGSSSSGLGASNKESSSKESSSNDKAGAATGSVDLSGEVKITADENTNSLVITASPKDYQTLIDKVISKLDIPRRQVYLEAVVMELNIARTRKLGLSGNVGDTVSAKGNDFSLFGSLLPNFSSSIAGIAQAAGGLAGGGFSSQTISFTDASGNKIEIPAISAIIQAIQTDTDANILSTPSILTLDNQEAQIQVGNEIGIPGTTTIGSGGVAASSVSREDTGIILKITPQISESDMVRLNLEQEVTSVVPSSGTDSQNLGPTLTKRSVKTVVVANDKQTIVIGGLIDDQDTVQTAKIPFLGDVPVIGNLFKNQAKTKQKTNIMIFITPYVIRDKSDYLDILKRKIEERNAFIDLNYGTGQKKSIRESIKNHASNLLEYQGAVTSSEKVEESTAEVATPVKAVEATPAAKVETPKKATPAKPVTQSAPKKEESKYDSQKPKVVLDASSTTEAASATPAEVVAEPAKPVNPRRRR